VNITRKWVKRANMWALIIPDVTTKTKQPTNRITWHDEMPELVDIGEKHGTSPGDRLAKAKK
jgi:hypothetical protein